MLKKGLIFILATMISVSMQQALAQEKGQVIVVKDSLITQLQLLRAEMKINPVISNPTEVSVKTLVRSTGNRVKVRGYRVQIYAGPNRTQAFNEQTRFRNMYRDLYTYITYDEPNYRVKVGDFTSRSQANTFMQELRQQFKNVFVFSEDVFIYQ